MGVHEALGIDLIRELRLRQWARTHYVAERERSMIWHPVVLDEMRRRDDEVQEANQQQATAASRLLPREPGTKIFAEAS